MKLVILIIIIIYSFPAAAQYKDQEIESQNGYYWLLLSSPVPYTNPRHDFLSGMLERYKIIRIAENKDYLSDCRKELKNLQEDMTLKSFGLDVVVKAINNFYSFQENLEILIVDAYCYCVKEIAGAGNEELSRYKNELIKRYKN
ncbi:MAG TPA: hypothetical protein VK870_07295 [Ignavibacteriaceae bacterium]|nr:hypothetical protein [Ignavibacteriaceae bacterium]